jgi:hypothetical protein
MSSCAIPPGMLNARRIDPSPSYRALMRLSRDQYPRAVVALTGLHYQPGGGFHVPS